MAVYKLILFYEFEQSIQGAREIELQNLSITETWHKVTVTITLHDIAWLSVSPFSGAKIEFCNCRI